MGYVTENFIASQSSRTTSGREPSVGRRAWTIFFIALINEHPPRYERLRGASGEVGRRLTDWCAVRVAGAELGQWNGDHIVKEFDSTYE